MYVYKKIQIMILSLLIALFSYGEDAVVSSSGPTAQPIAIPDLSDSSGGAIGAQIAETIANDLTRFGLFFLVDKNAYVDKSTADQRPIFSDWRAINATFLIKGKVIHNGDQITVQYRLWDTLREKQLLGLEHSGSISAWRKIAHIMADHVYQEVIGEAGYFNSRIVYIAESGEEQNLQRRLAIMDQDGANHAYLTDGSSLVLTPRFSPALQEITYISYESGIPKVYLLDIATGRKEILGSFEGMTFAPRFSPDGNEVVMSQSLEGETNIFRVNLRSGQKIQLTSGPAIDTAPSYSPDGKNIVFESDRQGSQQLYIMNVDGSNVRRISHGEGRYATPVWSPRGDLIAYTRMYGGLFYIGVIQPDGKGDRLLSKDYLVEGPTWSPNGRVIAFTRQSANGAEKKLYAIDITGFFEREIKTPLAASDPAWSSNNN